MSKYFDVKVLNTVSGEQFTIINVEKIEVAANGNIIITYWKRISEDCYSHYKYVAHSMTELVRPNCRLHDLK